MRKFNVNVNGVSYEVEIEEVDAAQTSAPVSAPAVKSVPAPAAKQTAASGTAVKAPMPGTVVKVNVKEGQSVKRGDVLCLLEAMKMENEICAPCDGTVSGISAVQGETVASDAVLFTIA